MCPVCKARHLEKTATETKQNSQVRFTPRLRGENNAAAVATLVRERAWDHKVPGSNPGSAEE